MTPQKLISALVGLLMCVSTTAAANVVTVSEVSGIPGAEVTVTLAVDNDTPLTGLQIDLPFGSDAELSVIDGSATATGRAAGHSISVGRHAADGTVTVMLFTTAGATIGAGSGEVATFGLRLGDKAVDVEVTPSVKASAATGGTVAFGAEPVRLTVLKARAEFVDRIDFGRVPLRNSYTRNIEVTNTGTAPLTITGARFSAENLTAENLPLTVDAGASSAVTVSYSPTVRGAIESTVMFECNSTGTRNLTEIAATPYAVNELAIGSVSGISDCEVEVPVTLTNMDPITGFTLEITLPSQLQYVDGSFALADSRADGHSMRADCSNGVLKAVAYSASNKPFRANEGQLATFRVRLAGRYGAEVKFDKAVLAAIIDDKTQNVTSDTYAGRVDISAPQISVSSSVSMGRTPITETASASVCISNYGSAPLTVSRIDANGGNVAVEGTLPLTIEPWQNACVELECNGDYRGDFTDNLNIYCNDPDQRLVNVAVSGTRYSPNFVQAPADAVSTRLGVASCPLTLSNNDVVTGLQFDLTYPAEAFEPVGEVTLSERAEGFSVSHSAVSDGLERYFVYSVSNATIAPGSGVILTVPLKAKSDADDDTYPARISAVKIGTDNLTDVNSDQVNNSAFNLIKVTDNYPTGITEVSIDYQEPYTVYDLDGVEVSQNVLTLPRGVYIVKQGHIVKKIIMM